VPTDEQLAASVPSPPPVPAAADEQPPEAAAAKIPTTRGLLRWLGVAAAASLLVIGFLLVRGRGRGRSASPGGPAPPSTNSISAAEGRLRKACDANDAGAALAALREIGRARWPLSAPSGSAGWGVRLGAPALRQSIAEAEFARYAPDAAAWKGSQLWKSYRIASKRSTRPRQKAAILPELYPSPEAKAG
jgi:hypothetical protein